MRVELRPVDEAPATALPPRLAELLRPELSSLADEIVEEIRSTIPEYARPLDSTYGKTIAAGVRHAIGLFVDQIADPAAPARSCHDVHRRLGQLEMSEGRSLDALQAAYRVGARVSWRRIMRVGTRVGLSSAVMSQLADAVFAFMDQLASVALDGYLEAKACTAGALETWRRRLLKLILESPPAPARAVVELARLTGWTVPDDVTPVAVRPPFAPASQRRPLLEPDVLADLDGVEPHLLVPGPVAGRRLAALRAALPDSWLAIGLPVPLDLAADSLRWARRTLALADRGVIDAGPIMFCEEHLATLLVRSDDILVAQLGRRLFAPLEQLTAKQRARLLETLRAWLDTQGSVPDIASALGVHPQTVRYRLRQLDAAFTGRLDDPRTRFEMRWCCDPKRSVVRPVNEGRVRDFPDVTSPPPG